MDIPSTHQTVMPYLILNEAKKFLLFTQKVFGAQVTHESMRDENTLGHCEIQIGGCTIMFSDTANEWSENLGHLFIYVANADETFKKAIEEGASVIMEMADQPYGRSGGIKDPCGNTWWITSAVK